MRLAFYRSGQRGLAGAQCGVRAIPGYDTRMLHRRMRAVLLPPPPGDVATAHVRCPWPVH